jgi:hypothetical protein
VSGTGDSPFGQFAAAWRATAAVAAEWAERTAAVTAEAFRKLTSDPAIRAVVDAWHITAVWPGRGCECPCAVAHPEDIGVCDHRAVITRKVSAGPDSEQSVPLCAPCAVAQGVAEMPR